jgi:enoyl-CoA hydratase/carnithine racemase
MDVDMSALKDEEARPPGSTAAGGTSEIVTERSGGILRIQFNRPAKKNALTANMYSTVADLINAAAKDAQIRVVLVHGAGDAFSAGNDLEDFMRNPPKPGESVQERFVTALINCDKPLIAAVHGATVGSGMTMLAHCDFVYAGESTRFQLPFVNLAVVPELGTSFLIPAQIGHIAAAELFLLGMPFDARRAAELGLVTRVVSDERSLPTAMETAQILAAKPAGALQASKGLLKRWSREHTVAAVRTEGQEFAVRVRSEEACEAITAFLEKRRPDFSHIKSAPGARP